MKWIIPVLFIAFLGTGCAAINSGNVTDAQFQILVQQDATQVQQAAVVATGVTLNAISDAKTKVEVGALAYNVASAINAAAAAPNFDFTSIESLVTSLLNQSNVNNKQLVASLVDAVLLEGEQLLNAQPSLSQDRRVILAKAMIAGATQGIMSQTATFAPHKPDLARAVKGG